MPAISRLHARGRGVDGRWKVKGLRAFTARRVHLAAAAAAAGSDAVTMATAWSDDVLPTLFNHRLSTESPLSQAGKCERLIAADFS